MSIMSSRLGASVESDFERPSTFLDTNNDEDDMDINIVWVNEDDDDDDDEPPQAQQQKKSQESRQKRWGKLKNKNSSAKFGGRQYNKKTKYTKRQQQAYEQRQERERMKSPKERKRRTLVSIVAFCVCLDCLIGDMLDPVFLYCTRAFVCKQIMYFLTLFLILHSSPMFSCSLSLSLSLRLSFFCPCRYVNVF